MPKKKVTKKSKSKAEAKAKKPVRAERKLSADAQREISALVLAAVALLLLLGAFSVGGTFVTGLFRAMRLVVGYAAYLSPAFVDEDFHLRSVLTGAQELQMRWLRVLTAEDEALGFGLGEMYVARNFSPAAKQAATVMVERVRDALRDDLPQRPRSIARV